MSSPENESHLYLVQPPIEVVVEPSSVIGLDARPEVTAFLVQPADDHHVVQFYEDDVVLCNNVARYLQAGLTAGEPVLVIATPPHRIAFRQRLEADGVDVNDATARGQLVWRDARETMATFMVNGRPSQPKFVAVIGEALDKIRDGKPGRVRAYGEMVDCLWRDGNKPAALELETLWNEIKVTQPMSLLCAYAIGSFYKPGDAEDLRAVCATHSHVISTEGGGAGAQLDEIGRLQAQARRLEREVEYRKEVEVALRDALAREKSAREEAERNVRFNEMFAGMLGHDLRNPLSAIMTGATYIARTNSGEKATRTATRILSSAERMARMIEQLLDFTRIRVGGGLALNPTRFDLGDMCCRIKDELEAAHPECFITLEPAGNSVGEWDYDRMLQVLSNLTGNAIVHGSAGCRVRIAADGLSKAQVRVSVHNQGLVPPDILPVLFEPFRGSSRHQKTQGLGLGLFISRQIVVAHGGSIEVESSPEAGTTFHVLLPRIRPRMLAAPATPEP